MPGTSGKDGVAAAEQVRREVTKVDVREAMGRNGHGLYMFVRPEMLLQ